MKDYVLAEESDLLSLEFSGKDKTKNKGFGVILGVEEKILNG